MDEGISIEDFLKTATRKTQDSLAVSRELLEVGYPSPALVWAVRAAEIFFKDFLLTPHFFEVHGDWAKAIKEARKLFGSGDWNKAIARVDQVYGPLDKMIAEGGADALRVWTRDVVRLRGDVVHGRINVDSEIAREALSMPRR